MSCRESQKRCQILYPASDNHPISPDSLSEAILGHRRSSKMACSTLVLNMAKSMLSSYIILDPFSLVIEAGKGADF